MCTFMVAYNTFCQFSLPLNEMLLQLTDVEAIKNCIMECHTRIEMGKKNNLKVHQYFNSNFLRKVPVASNFDLWFHSQDYIIEFLIQDL